jgi:hypothetical protein
LFDTLTGDFVLASSLVADVTGNDSLEILFLRAQTDQQTYVTQLYAHCLALGVPVPNRPYWGTYQGNQNDNHFDSPKRLPVSRDSHLPASALFAARAWPNPARGIWQIDAPSEDSYSLRLYSPQGQLVWQQAQYQAGEAIYLPDLPAGIYLWELQSLWGQRAHGKLVWQP